MMRRAFLAFALACGLVGAADAAPLPRYAAGQAFIFDNGRVELVREVRNDRVVWSARSGRPYVRSANPVVPILEWSFRGQTGRRTVLGDPDRLWPLRAGRRVEFRTLNVATDADERARRSIHLWSCAARTPVTLDVPAGRFTAIPVVCDRFSHNSMRVLERLTWHYSEEVGHYIRREARDMSDGSVETYALFATLPPHAANDVRIETLARQARAASAGSRPQR